MAQLKSFEEILDTYGSLAFPIKGISMLPLIRSNKDIITILPKTTERLKRYDIPLFRRDNGEYVVHRVLKVLPNGTYGICGDNQSFIEYVREDQIIGVVTSITRGDKVINVVITPDNHKLSLWYKFYVHVWCDFFWIRAICVKIEHKLIQCLNLKK